jgi:site-specific DNA recombinase
MSVVADNARNDWLLVSFNATNRRAAAGAYLGGPVPYGYALVGEKETAHLEPDDTIVWGELTGADVVRRIYRSIALEGRTCPSIAAEFNALGIPTQEALPGRRHRRKGTQLVWRSGRIRQLVVNPLYMGIKRYGVNQKQRRWLDGPVRELIEGSVRALVSPELWQAAQAALGANRRVAKNSTRRYILKGVITCATCGLTYGGSPGRPGQIWYRCSGKHAERGPLEGACPSPYLRADAIEPVVWTEIERFLRNPGDALSAIEAEFGADDGADAVKRERAEIRKALGDRAQERKRVQLLVIKGRMTDNEADDQFERIESERVSLEARLIALDGPQRLAVDETAVDLLEELRSRLDAGLTDEQRAEIVKLLVKITITTEPGVDGRKGQAQAAIEYRFPRFELGVLQTHTGIGSSPRQQYLGYRSKQSPP